MNSGGAEYSRNDDIDSVAQMKAAEEALQAKEKQKPSFELSGKLAAETNRFRGEILLPLFLYEKSVHLGCFILEGLSFIILACIKAFSRQLPYYPNLAQLPVVNLLICSRLVVI